MPHRDVRSLVLSVDDEKLSEQVLRQLGKFMPGKDEVCVCVCMRVCVRAKISSLVLDAATDGLP